jgi:hypothetical protein
MLTVVSSANEISACDVEATRLQDAGFHLLKYNAVSEELFTSIFRSEISRARNQRAVG